MEAGAFGSIGHDLDHCRHPMFETDGVQAGAVAEANFQVR